MASEKISRKMVLEIKYVNAKTPLYTPKTLNFCLTGILAQISLGTGIWYPPSRPSHVDADTGSCYPNQAELS